MVKPLSVCIITYNEEKNIRRCLESVKWANEIVVIDSKSTDSTVSICQEYTKKIILRDFPGHIEQKNFAIDQCKEEWILSVDADEVVTEGLKKEIWEILQKEKIPYYGYVIPRKNDYLGTWATYGGFYPDLKLRFFHKKYGRWGGINPHDHILLKEKAGRLKNNLLHYTYKDLAHHVQVINNFTTIASNQQYQRKTKFSMTKAIFRSIGRFIDSYFVKGAIFHGPRGLIFAVQHSYYGFLKYAKTWELYEMEKNNHPKNSQLQSKGD